MTSPVNYTPAPLPAVKRREEVLWFHAQDSWFLFNKKKEVLEQATTLAEVEAFLVNDLAPFKAEMQEWIDALDPKTREDVVFARRDFEQYIEEEVAKRRAKIAAAS